MKPKIFTIGSCFAREIRVFLEKDGFEVTPKDMNDILVYYNTYSILYEFQQLENVEVDFYQNSNGKWQNPFRRLLIADSLEELEIKTKKHDENMKNWINESDVFIITLGMSEVFKSKNTGLVYSNHPQYGLGKIKAGVQGDFYDVTIEDNYNNLKKIVESVTPKKIILTVSPVPLMRTFTKLNKNEANKISKNKLIVASKQIAEDFPNVEYYDSYEYATGIGDIYETDGRHVRKEIVRQIVNRFHERNYF